MVCARGRKETVEAIRMLADEMEERCRKGETTFRGEPRHRIMMEGIACWPHLRHNYQTLKESGDAICAVRFTPRHGEECTATWMKSCCPTAWFSTIRIWSDPVTEESILPGELGATA